MESRFEKGPPIAGRIASAMRALPVILLPLLTGAFFILPPPASGAEAGGAAATHWAYRPPVAPALTGKGHPIDELLGRRLAEQGLAPAPPASREVLLRRAWHVLTGLQADPPTRERFLTMGGELPAWTKAVVEEALAGPHFGERWARHWLDTARYADTKGYNFQGGRRYPYAFTYRDWVVRSLNEDLPYDEFVRRQIAADLLELPPAELAALGYLTVGRRFLGKEDLIIADRIDVVFRGAMGVTMQCARCHDHKSDPLTAADYYGIYGIFNSIYEPSEADLPVISEPDDSAGYREFLAELTKRANEAHDYAAKKIGDYQRPADPLVFDRNAAAGRLNQSERGDYERLIARMTELEATSEFAPGRAMIVRDHDKPREPVIFERGQPGSRGPQVPRAFPAFFRADSARTYTKGSGRLELAEDLTRPGNPLTARVWANRVWMHVMGEPLVDTPGDFGVHTPPPLHPELLDHLAVYLVGHGWSTKALIRHIMFSEAWARGSEAAAALIAADSENRYYARSNRQRKDLEAWRDTTLQASGRLERRVGGRPVRIDEPPFPPRRSIYGLIERQNPPSFFRIFDFPDSNQPVDRRATTTTPNQALYLMNSPFLHGEAKTVSAATAGEGELSKRVAALYERVLQRVPTAEESDRAGQFLAAGGVGKPQSAGAWRYGHGRLHRDSGSIEFNEFTHFTGTAWQVGPVLPDPTFGWVNWNVGGGHPGHGDHAVILRWEAPHPAAVKIEGRLERSAKAGDGVRALIVTEGRVVREWEVHPGRPKTATVATLAVQAGQVIDFVVESKGDENSDSFLWAPVIREEGDQLPLAEAKEGFSGPGLDPWAQLAQVLLLSNEFLFVD